MVFCWNILSPVCWFSHECSFFFILQAAAAFLSQPNPGKYSAPGFSDFISSMSPRNSISQSPLITAGFTNGMVNGGGNYNEVQRLREELQQNKTKMSQWEERIGQARAVRWYLCLQLSFIKFEFNSSECPWKVTLEVCPLEHVTYLSNLLYWYLLSSQEKWWSDAHFMPT